MTKKALQAVSTLAIFLLVASAAPVSSDHFGEPDREATYIGSGGLDHGLNEHWIPACESVFGENSCPTPIPPGLIMVSCDEDSWIGLGAFQGIGGVLFCGVPTTATFALSIHDAGVDPVTAMVACLTTRAKANWYSPMEFVEGFGMFSLPDDCPRKPAWHESDPPGTTRIAVFIYGPPTGLGATMGEVMLNFLE